MNNNSKRTIVNNITEINFLNINNTINLCREILIKKDFKEINLFLTSKYKTTSKDSIITSTGKILRNSTEPDIWELANGLNKFFCFTSLFRNEEYNTPTHKEEFKIVDFYINNSSIQQIFEVCREIMMNIENKFSFPPLSKVEFIEIDFDEYKKGTRKFDNGKIINVINYPIEESFFDATNSLTEKTFKGELFYMDNGNPIEFCVYGKVGENLNPNNTVFNFNLSDYINLYENLHGMCFGIERLLMIYHKASEI